MPLELLRRVEHVSAYRAYIYSVPVAILRDNSSDDHSWDADLDVLIVSCIPRRV